MKWPFVSRARYDDLQSKYTEVVRADNASWWSVRAEVDVSHKAYDGLLSKYHELKLSGASVPEPPKTLERPEFDPVMAAITAKAGQDRKLRAMMSAEAMRSRQAGITDIEIIQAIEHGVTVDCDL